MPNNTIFRIELICKYHRFLSSFIVHTMYKIEIEKLYACYRLQSFGSYLTNSFAMEKDNF